MIEGACLLGGSRRRSNIPPRSLSVAYRRARAVVTCLSADIRTVGVILRGSGLRGSGLSGRRHVDSSALESISIDGLQRKKMGRWFGCCARQGLYCCSEQTHEGRDFVYKAVW